MKRFYCFGSCPEQMSGEGETVDDVGTESIKEDLESPAEVATLPEIV